MVPAKHDGRTAISIRKVASGGVYPIEFTLRHPGRYRMSITDARREVGVLGGGQAATNPVEAGFTYRGSCQ